MKEARRQGARVWLVDTHQTATAAVVDRTFVVRPGSDGALCLGLMHLLAREGLAAEGFLAAEAQGWPELKAAVLADHPPARTAALTGLDEATLLELARALAEARAPVIRIGEGLSRYGNGAMNVRSIAALAAVSGVMSKGGGFYWGASSSAAFPLGAFTRPDFMARPTRTINMVRLGHALNELDAPRVMSICVYASNPAAVAPDQNAVLRGLAREDLFTVVHERFLTDTARFADVLLPATTSLEHADLYRSYGHYVVQRARPAVPPLGEALPNWELFRRLARAFGFEGAPFDLDADGVIDLLLATPSPWRDGFDLAALDAGRPVTLTPPPGPRWRTPSGKVELLNPRHREPLPRLLPTHAGAGGAPAPAPDRAGPLLAQLHLHGPRRPGRQARPAAGPALARRGHGARDRRRRPGGRLQRARRGDDAGRGDGGGAGRAGGGGGGPLGPRHARRPQRQRAHLAAAHRRGGRLDLLRQPDRRPARRLSVAAGRHAPSPTPGAAATSCHPAPWRGPNVRRPCRHPPL